MSLLLSPLTNNNNIYITNMAGVAGRTNYAQWDKVASDLVKDVVAEEQEEIAESALQLGLDGKYPHSKAEADERTKAQQVNKTKKALDTYKEREQSVLQTFSGLLGPVDNTIMSPTRITIRNKRFASHEKWWMRENES